MEVMVLAGSGARLGFRVLSTWRSRLRGLLGTSVEALPVVLVGCSSIHTFGMGYPIDVALVAEDGRVLKARRGLRPGRLLGHRRARYAFERPRNDAPWMDEGEVVSCAGGVFAHG